MATNKKYYYLKLKENFYESEQLIILQNMQDGYLYSDILMKLYLRSLKTEGKLMFNDLIPYTPSVLAQIVRHQVGTVEKALKIFKELGLIEILDNGAIYMMDIQNFIGKSSSEGDRKREYRAKIQNEKNNLLGQMSDKRPPEIEIELEIEKDIEIEKEKNGMYTKCIQDGYTGKDRLELGKDRLGEDSQGNNNIQNTNIQNTNIKSNNTPYNPSTDDSQKYDNKIFEKFWNEYPKKISKGNAEKWFKKNKPTNDLVDLMIEKLKIYKETEQWKKDNGKYIPYPSSWLNAKGWEDEIQSNNIKRKYDTSIVYHDKYIGDYKLDENGRRIFV